MRTKTPAGSDDRNSQANDSNANPAQDHAESQAPSPVTHGRIAAQLRSQGYSIDSSSEDHISGIWNNNFFRFYFLGDKQETLQIRATWKGTIPEHSHLAALQASNDWNRDYLWPKTYIIGSDEMSALAADELAAIAEVSIDVRHGATDAQLEDIIGIGLQTSLQFFDSLHPLAGDSAQTH